MSKDIFQASRDNDIHARQPTTLWTPLHHTAGHSQQAAQLLLRGGAQPNAQGQCGESPLHLATAPEMARLPDMGGTTPLDWAVQEIMTDLFLALAYA